MAQEKSGITFSVDFGGATDKPRENAWMKKRERKLARLRKKRSMNGEANKPQKFSDPLEEFAFLLSQSKDKQLHPHVFMEYLVLLIRSFLGVKRFFCYNTPIGRLINFAHGDLVLAGIPNRSVQASLPASLYVLSDKYMWDPIPGIEFDAWAGRISHYAFLNCGEEITPTRQKNDRFACVFAPSDFAPIPQAFNPVHEMAPLLLYRIIVSNDQTQNATDDEKSENSSSMNANSNQEQDQVLLRRQHVNEVILFVWRQDDAVFALKQFIKRRQTTVQLIRVIPVFTPTTATKDIRMDSETVWEFTSQSWWKSKLLISARLDDGAGRLVGCDVDGRIVRFDPSQELILASDPTSIKAFGYLASMERFVGIERDGTLVDVKETWDTTPCEFVKRDSLSLWGVRHFYIDTTTETLFLVMKQMSSSNLKYSMLIYPLSSLEGNGIDA